MANLSASFTKAEAAVGKDPRKALAPLLEAWSAQPAIETSRLISLLEAVVAPPAFDGETAAWVRAAKSADAWTKSSLLQRVRGKTIADTQARLTAALAWGADPRTARVLEEMVTELPWTSDSSKPLWRVIYAGITKMKDPRFAALARSLPPKWVVRENISGWLTNSFVKAAGEGTVKPLGADVLEAVGKLGQKLEALAPKKKPIAQDEAGLLADVYANPDDDAPRLVYADWLLERGDPRGEFITLQFRADKDAAALAREKALLEEHGRTWLGPLAPVVALGTFEFRRGFLSKADKKFKASTEALRASPAWGTVEETSATGAELTSPAMRGLKRLTGSWAEELLATTTPWPFEQVTCAVRDLEEFRTLLHSPLFPRLKVLRVSHAEGRSVENAKWLAGLERVPAPELRLKVNFKEPVASWVAAAASLKGLQVLLLDDDLGAVWRWARDARGALTQLELRLDEARYLKETRERLAAIPGGVISTFTLLGSDDAALLATGRERAATTPAPARVVPTVKAGERPRLTEEESFIAIAWRAEGWWVAERDRVALIDPATGALVREFQINPSDRFGFTEDGTRVIAGKGASVRAYSLKTGKVEVTLGTGAGGVQDLKISRDGRFGLVAAEYHAYFFDLQAKKVLRKAKAKIYYRGAVAPDGSRFATPLEVQERPKPAFDVIQVMDGKPGSRSVKFGVDVSEPAWLPDGRIICAERDLHRLAIFDSVTGERQLTIEGGLEFPHLLVVSPTGTHATCWSDDHLALLDLVKGAVVWRKKQATSQLDVAFSPDGQQVVLAAATPFVIPLSRR